MTKNAIFGQICVVLRQRILIFTGESKSLGAHITKNHLGTFLYDILARHWTKCQCLAQNEQKCHYWAKFGRFWAKNPYSFGRKQKFWYPRNKKNPRHLVRIVFGRAFDKSRPKMPVLVQIWPFLGQKSNFLGAGRKTFGTLISGVQ